MTEPYYQAGGITIYHGDCRDVLPGLAEYSAVVSEVPYGRALRSGWNGAHGDCRIENDKTTELRDWMLLQIKTPAIVFGSPFVPRPIGVTPDRVLIWDKGEHVGMGDLSWPWKPNYEEIYIIGNGFNGPRSGSVLHHLAIAGTVAVTQGRDHPTQKPVSLMRALILKCPTGTILDPFMGSGSTLRAAKDLGRRAIGIEIEERYCDVAARRLQQEVMDLA